MKYCPLVSEEKDRNALESEYKGAREIGKVGLGELHLFFRSGRRIYYIPYRDVRRCFRRVQLVPARLFRFRGDLQVENLVVCGEQGELAQIQLPGTRAAKDLMKELEQRIPEAEFGKPADPKTEKTE